MPGGGCSVEVVTLDGRALRRIRLGDESADWWLGREPDRSCHDCSVFTGQLHHIGCDMEQCPVCGGQMLACGCAVGDT